MSPRENICEWLSCVEWCDVQLSCGGRIFNAHRAVLASVSLFLRKVLLSCIQEESPTFIVLPDFDLDAFSLVLYYIYNGEVTVKKQNIHKFFDIIKVLEIYVDQQYLRQIRDSIGDRNFDLCTYRECKWPKSVYNLSVGDSNEHEYVNIRKGEWLQDLRLRYSLSDTDLGDKRTCLILSDVQPSLDNPPAPHGNRQRNSFLRDLYIETYPQNGNVNGLTGGVLAIQNERYRTPTSVLLTNANGKFASIADDTFSEMSRETTEFTSYIPDITRTPLPYIKQCIEPSGDSSSKIPNDSSLFNGGGLENMKILVDNDYYLSTRSKTPWLRCYPSQLTSQLYSIGIQQGKPSVSKIYPSSLDLTNTQTFVDSKLQSAYIHSQKNAAENLQLSSRYSCKHVVDKESCASSKPLREPIFNQVLNSPWCPRLPYGYKPFRRKPTHVSDYSLHYNKVRDVAIINDSNNNIEKTLTQAQCNNGQNMKADNIKDEFKCNLCSQVFRSSETLEIHSKRHTTDARYSCTECGKTFSQLRNFKYHMSVHRGTREFAATCTVCGKYFNDRGYLSSHMKIHRNRKEYKCTQCPKSFNQRVAYNMHVRIHTGVKPHVCEECGKAFSRKMLLKQHQRTHSGERPYACPHCEKRFADRSNMTLHLRLHTGVKPFSCSLCPKSFTKKHHLKSHLNFHTGAKPYSCPRCKLAFTQSSNMRTHLKKCNAPEVTPEIP